MRSGTVEIDSDQVQTAILLQAVRFQVVAERYEAWARVFYSGPELEIRLAENEALRAKREALEFSVYASAVLRLRVRGWCVVFLAGGPEHDLEGYPTRREALAAFLRGVRNTGL